jgi:hypothetical protein
MCRVVMCSPKPFNAVFRELITVVKNGTSDAEIKNDIKRRYRAWDAACMKHAEDFHLTFSSDYPVIVERGAAKCRDSIGDRKLMVDRSVDSVFATLTDAPAVRAHACLIALLSLSMAAHVCDEASANVAALKATERVLSDVACESELPNVILDEDLVSFVKGAGALLRLGGSCGLPVVASVSEEGSIMNLARGITEGIDPNVLDSPDGLQSLIASVSAGIGEQMSSGKLDVAALMKEASALLGNVDLSALAGMMPPK